MNVIQKSPPGARTRRPKKSESAALDDIIHCLVYLEQQADRAGFAEVADLIGIARLAGQDAMNDPGAKDVN